MSSNHYLNDYQRRHPFYSDGITKITDPFWNHVCKKCGHRFQTCTAIVPCPKCGSKEADRWLGEIPYNQVIAERGEPIISE